MRDMFDDSIFLFHNSICRAIIFSDGESQDLLTIVITKHENYRKNYINILCAFPDVG